MNTLLPFLFSASASVPSAAAAHGQAASIRSTNPIYEHIVRFQAQTGIPITMEVAPVADHVRVPILDVAGQPYLDSSGDPWLRPPEFSHPLVMVDVEGDTLDAVEAAMRTVVEARPSWGAWDGCTRYTVNRAGSWLRVQPTFAMSSSQECEAWTSPLDQTVGSGITGTIHGGRAMQALLLPVGLGFLGGMPETAFPADGSGRTVRDLLDEMQNLKPSTTWRMSVSDESHATIVIYEVGAQTEHLNPADYPFHIAHHQERVRARVGKTKAQVDAEHAAMKGEVMEAIEAMRSRGEHSSEPEVIPTPEP